MGTTVSTNLGLVKPDLNESIKEALPTNLGWATQSNANMDKIDALFRDDVTNTYPINFSSTGTAPTLGTGSLTEGKYIRVTPRLVLAYYRIFLGTTGFVAGTGVYGIDLPVAMDPSLTPFTDSIPVGKAIYYDVSAAATSSVFEAIYNHGFLKVFFRPAAGNVWGATVPVVPGNSDRLSGYMLYPTAVA
jgi:hypothetical protein